MIVTGLKIVVGILAAFVALVFVIRSFGSLSWNHATGRAIARLRAARRNVRGTELSRRPVYFPADLEGLPAPVARYFRFALTAGQPLIRRAHMLQEGLFARTPRQWAPFTATEDFEVWPPGFVWDARITLAPHVTANVRDCYVQGEGSMLGKAAGVITVVKQDATREMAESSLLRYLAEAVWFPTALLPAAGVRWEAINDRSARASITDGAITASMNVHFGSFGEIKRITALRHRDVNGTPVLTPWEGRFTDYRRVDGMRIPDWSEVGWHLPEGWVAYWRGRNTLMRFTYAGENAVERTAEFSSTAPVLALR